MVATPVAVANDVAVVQWLISPTTLEVLHRPLMFFRRSSCFECAEILALAGFGIYLA